MHYQKLVLVSHQDAKNLKGGKKCQEEMEPDPKARDPEPVEAGDRAAAAGAEAVMVQDRAAAAYAPNAAKKQRINWGRRVLSKNVRNAGQL
jgi:hypothetical protein